MATIARAAVAFVLAVLLTAASIALLVVLIQQAPPGPLVLMIFGAWLLITLRILRLQAG